MSNRVNLTLDVTKTGIQNPLIKVRQGDGGFETLRTTVTSNGEPLDLQGWTITFMGTTAGSHKIVDGNVTLVEAPNGIFDYTPSKAWGMDIGEFKIAYFKFVKGDGSASSANFRVNVIEAVDLTQEEAQNYISVVDTTIAEINQHLTDSLAHVTQSIADANNNANTVSSNVTTLGNRVDEYNNKLAAVKIGGRNLLLGSRDWSGDNRWYMRNTLTNYQYRGNVIAATSSAWTGPIYNIQNTGSMQVGKIYTFSTYVKNTSDTDTEVAIYYDPAIVTPDGNSSNVPAHSDWTRIYTTFKVIKDPATSTYGLRCESKNNVTNGQIQFAGYKLEEGNVPTDWSPAPEDIASKVKTVYNIEDYGAKSFDMNFDNGKVINDILAKIGDNGGTILIPAGDFWLTTPIIVKRNYVTIQGINSGFRSNIDAEVGNGLSHPGAGSHLLLMPSLENGIIIGENGKSPRISGITIDRINIQGARERSATVSQTGINIVQDNDGVIISNNVIMNLNYGVIGNGSDAIAIRNNWICELQNAVQLLNGSQQPSITNNYFGAQPSGITLKLDYAMYANISGNNIYPDGFTNIELNNCTMSIISGNNIQSFYTGMITVNGGNNNSISSNMIYARSNGGKWVADPLGRDDKYGIIQISSDNTTVTANHIISEQPVDATRILVRKGNNVRISSNTILGNVSKNKIVCNGIDANNVVVFNSVTNDEFDSGLNTSNRNVWSLALEDNYKNTASTTANYFGATISFMRIGKLVTFTSGVSAFSSNVNAGLTSGVIPNGFKPALQQNVSAANQSSASNFFSFDDGGGIYSYGTYSSGAQPRISGTYITTDSWPV